MTETTNTNVGSVEPARSQRVTEAERRRIRQNQRNAARRVQTDMRTRVARRQRAIERELRAELVKMGRKILVHDELQIANLAGCLIQVEILTGERSRGGRIDIEQLTRLVNTSQRGIAALGLRPEIAKEPAPRLREYLNAHGDGEGTE